MSGIVSALNLALGIAYLAIGAIALIEIVQARRTLGFSHFGAGIVGLAFTCGPHHFAHGFHVAFEGRSGGPLDLVTVLVGLPTAAVWVGLRIEAFRRGRGDRFIAGTPRWLQALPTAAGMYLTALVSAGLAVGAGGLTLRAWMIPNVLLIGVYLTIASFLLRTQIRNRGPLRGWSLSGLSLTGIFPTCALMHAAWVVYAAAGRYEFDVHGFVAGLLAVPAGLYFLWTVRGLFLDTVRDWHVRSPERAGQPAAAG